ncbi:synaptosomal-associated protein 47 [Gouania willdenowi]|uniref:Synaptosomal-associated protein 47 n=1 Tax=Gouania willdenowi TaxID=441366 RepID=A0A8C5GAR5_GOUWI|nr:synaptosomal-associated protein 47 [Gouania willdenowi]
MIRDASIHSWPGSYYLSTERRWEYGVLSLSRTKLSFVSSQKKSGAQQSEVLASLRLSCIVEIKMESSSFIFGVLTVLEEGNIKHWFGSLKPSRAAVFNVLEHFWRERLLPEDADGKPPSSKGRELIGLVAGAQRRLQDAGLALSHQGEQFDSTMQGLEKMDSDLGVADRLLSELESPSWWPFGKQSWKTQPEAKADDAIKAAASAAAGRTSGRNRVVASIPAVVSVPGQEPRHGCLLLLVSSMEVRNASCQLLHRFERSEVDEVRVHSPYEVSIRQRFIGRPDVCFRLLSARLPHALPLLEIQYKKKLEFTGEYAAFSASRLSPSESEGAGAGTGLQRTQDSEVLLEVPAGELPQLQVLHPTVSQAEAQELKQMLMQLRTLALEAESELERQDEVLDVLTSSTDRVSMSIERQTGRMRRLL